MTRSKQEGEYSAFKVGALVTVATLGGIATATLVGAAIGNFYNDQPAWGFGELGAAVVPGAISGAGVWGVRRQFALARSKGL